MVAVNSKAPGGAAKHVQSPPSILVNGHDVQDEQAQSSASGLCRLALLQIILGVILWILNSVAVLTSRQSIGYIGRDYSGIWGGFLSIVAGGLGLAIAVAVSASGRSSNSIAWRSFLYVGLSIAAAVASAIAVAANSAWIAFALRNSGAYVPPFDLRGEVAETKESRTWLPFVACVCGIVTGLTNFIVCIVASSIFCCAKPSGNCCCCAETGGIAEMTPITTRATVSVPPKPWQPTPVNELGTKNIYFNENYQTWKLNQIVPWPTESKAT